MMQDEGAKPDARIFLLYVLDETVCFFFLGGGA